VTLKIEINAKTLSSIFYRQKFSKIFQQTENK